MDVSVQQVEVLTPYRYTIPINTLAKLQQFQSWFDPNTAFTNYRVSPITYKGIKGKEMKSTGKQLDSIISISFQCSCGSSDIRNVIGFYQSLSSMTELFLINFVPNSTFSKHTFVKKKNSKHKTHACQNTNMGFLFFFQLQWDYFEVTLRSKQGAALINQRWSYLWGLMSCWCTQKDTLKIF